MSNVEREPQNGYVTAKSWQCKCGGAIVHRLIDTPVSKPGKANARLVRQCDACAAQYGADFDAREMMELGARPLDLASAARPRGH